MKQSIRSLQESVAEAAFSAYDLQGYCVAGTQSWEHEVEGNNVHFSRIIYLENVAEQDENASSSKATFHVRFSENSLIPGDVTVLRVDNGAEIGVPSTFLSIDVHPEGYGPVPTKGMTSFEAAAALLKQVSFYRNLDSRDTSYWKCNFIVRFYHFEVRFRIDITYRDYRKFHEEITSLTAKSLDDLGKAEYAHEQVKLAALAVPDVYPEDFVKADIVRAVNLIPMLS